MRFATVSRRICCVIEYRALPLTCCWLACDRGQVLPKDSQQPVFKASGAVDFELEVVSQPAHCEPNDKTLTAAHGWALSGWQH